MASSTLAGLAASGALTGTELFYSDNGAADVKVTATQIKTWTSASPTLVTPALGTPISGTLTNCTGLPPGGIAAIGANTVLGSVAGGAPIALTSAQLDAIVAASSGGGTTNFLRADGTWAAPAGGGGGLPIVGNGATVTVSTPLLDLSQTWNGAAVAFIGARYTVTPTAYGNNSDTLQLTNSGVITSGNVHNALHVTEAWGAGSIGNSGFRFDLADTGANHGSSYVWSYYNNGTLFAYMTLDGSILQSQAAATIQTFGISIPGGVQSSGTQWVQGSAYAFGWGNATPGTLDTVLVREAAGIIGQRSSVAGTTSAGAQGYHLYNTIDSTGNNWERGVFDWTTTANTLTIGTQAAGTGSGRDLALTVPNNSHILFAPSGTQAAFANGGASLNSGFQLRATWVYGWSSGNFTLDANDTALGRAAAGVVQFSKTINTSDGWMQWAGQTRVAADVSSNNSTTLGVATGLSVSLQAGRTYSFDVYLSFTCTPAQGIRAAMVGTSGLTATAIEYDGWIVDSAANGIKGNAQAAALGGVVANAATVGTAGVVQIKGTITVNVAGTLQVQFAQSVAAANNTTVKRGSYMIVYDMP